MKHLLLFCLALLLSRSTTAYAQTTQGYSSQTQPSIVFQTAYLRETLRDSLLKGKLPMATEFQVLSNKLAAINKTLSGLREKRKDADSFEDHIKEKVCQLVENTEANNWFAKRKISRKLSRDLLADPTLKKEYLDNLDKKLAEAKDDSTKTRKEIADLKNKAASSDKLLSVIYATIVKQADNDRTKEVNAPEGGVDIAAADRLLAVYDYPNTYRGSNNQLAWWLPQVIADGDFSRLSGTTDQASPKAGTIGVDAVRLKGIYNQYTYIGKDEYSGQNLPELTGYRNVYVPSMTFTMLFTLFGQGTPLSTGLKAGVGRTQHATRDVTRLFGQTLLAPGGLAQGGHSGLLSYSCFPVPKLPISLEATLLYSHTTWSTRDSATTVNILAPSVGIGYQIFGRYLNHSVNQPQIRVFARYAMRHLFGDIQDQPRLLLDVFQSTQRTYHGLDFGATASTSALRVTISCGLYNGDIEGFSHGQMVYGLGLAAGIRL